mgnify:CR=1 FL=1
MKLLFLSCLCADLFAFVEAPNWLQSRPLGLGIHAQPQFYKGTAQVYQNLQRLFKDKVLKKGKPGFKNKFGVNHTTRLCCAFLLNVSAGFVQKSLKYLKDNAPNLRLPAPKKRGRKKLTPQQYQQKYGTMYNAIFEYLKECKKKGDVATVDKMNILINQESQVEISYDALRYYLIRLGFKQGRISRRVTTSRNKDYVIQWLLSYADRRAKFARDPDHAKDEVHFYLDESFIYRNDAGNFSWYVDGDQHKWAKPSGTKHRWGIFHGIFDWFEAPFEAGGGVDDNEGRARKRRKKNAHPDPVIPGLTRRMETFMETFHCWNCADGNNMNTTKFLECLEKVLTFFQANWGDHYKLVLHLDNASYHKTRNPTFLDLDAANLEAITIANWIVNHAPAEYGYDDLESLQDENSDLLDIDTLKAIVRNQCDNHPDKITNLVKSFDDRYDVDFTPPYWPHFCAVELLWNNLKNDYRRWDSTEKISHVATSVRRFMTAVTPEDCEGWVRHTDEICMKIADRDAATLADFELVL